MRRLLVRPIPPFPSRCYGNFFFLFRLPPSAAEKGKGGGGGWKRMTTHKRTQEIFMEEPGGRRGSVSSFLPTVFSHRKGEEGKTSIFPLFGGLSAPLPYSAAQFRCLFCLLFSLPSPLLCCEWRRGLWGLFCSLFPLPSLPLPF